MVLVPHVQSRPDDQSWQYYYIAFPAEDHLGNMGEMLVGVASTGEQISNDGRVYEGESISDSTVDLPSFGMDEFMAVKEGLGTNNDVLTQLGWSPLGSIPETLEDMLADGSYLPSTYHYHGMLCPQQVSLSRGFYACDLSRMCSKWAGSTSVASGAMGVQCGKEVAAILAE